MPHPKWSTLGADLVTATADANSGDHAKIAADAQSITAECGSIPPEAKKAGGF